MEFKWTEKKEMKKAEFLAVFEACEAIFSLTPDSKEGTFDSCGFPAEGALIVF